MPANLTPQYSKAEEEYRKAQSVAEQIACLESMLQLIPKHKGTEKLQADLKTKLKETREELAAEKKAPKKGKSFKIPRQGAGQIVVLGGPNAGKSRLLKELTNAQPEVAPYPFTTREPLPGMMPWEDVMVQLIDTPPITSSMFESSLSGTVRSADAVVLCLDGSSDNAPDETEEVVRQFQSRKTLLSTRTGFDEEDYSIVQVRTLLLLTHGSDPGIQDRIDYFRELVATPFETLTVDFDDPEALPPLRERIYRLLDLIRVYTKAPGKPAVYESPFTLPQGATVEDLASKVHRELAEKVKFAKIWGTSLPGGQSAGREHPLNDKDLVELHT
jgi:uncharacterized protein